VSAKAWCSGRHALAPNEAGQLATEELACFFCNLNDST